MEKNDKKKLTIVWSAGIYILILFGLKNVVEFDASDYLWGTLLLGMTVPSWCIGGIIVDIFHDKRA